jgi:DMSO/TMAO reductase YedYZ molybdopterin-dependent catalytic subunit
MPMLRTVTVDPWNAEASLASLRDECTPTEAFYVRNNFVPPVLDAKQFRLRVGGAVERAVELDLDTLRSMRRVERRVTLECAGNGRILLDPPAPGTQWGLGAAGTAVFAGVALADVLVMAGVRAGAVEAVFTGADRGAVPEHGVVPFQRSLPIDVARADGPLLAWEMNGAPLTRDHGFPLRLVVPGWYAVASVKWLTDIELVERPFTGHFQLDRYVYLQDGAIVAPVSTMRVRSLITSHADAQSVRAGGTRIEGVAWSGAHAIARVDVSVDDGEWIEARLDGTSHAGEMIGWASDLTLSAGAHRVRARATDASGETQPARADWNELGYGNNAIQEVQLDVG